MRRGFNLTMPLKVHILPLLDELTPAALLTGAVNTVMVKEGKLIGHTTERLRCAFGEKYCGKPDCREGQ